MAAIWSQSLPVLEELATRTAAVAPNPNANAVEYYDRSFTIVGSNFLMRDIKIAINIEQFSSRLENEFDKSHKFIFFEKCLWKTKQYSAASEFEINNRDHRIFLLLSVEARQNSLST